MYLRPLNASRGSNIDTSYTINKQDFCFEGMSERSADSVYETFKEEHLFWAYFNNRCAEIHDYINQAALKTRVRFIELALFIKADSPELCLTPMAAADGCVAAA